MSLPEFVHGNASLQSIVPYGERSDYPDLSDEAVENSEFPSNPAMCCV